MGTGTRTPRAGAQAGRRREGKVKGNQSETT